MNKAEALKRIRELVNAEYPLYSLDGVETLVEGVPEPIYTNYKTAQFYRDMEIYAEKHPENNMEGVDYIDLLAKHIADNPDVFYFSPAGTEFEFDAWIMKRWTELPGMIGYGYMKWFNLEGKEPVLDIHIN